MHILFDILEQIQDLDRRSPKYNLNAHEQEGFDIAIQEAIIIIEKAIKNNAEPSLD